MIFKPLTILELLIVKLEEFENLYPGQGCQNYMIDSNKLPVI